MIKKPERHERQSTQTATVEQPRDLGEELLTRKTTTKEMLRQFCRQRGLADDGTKAKLVKRLLGEGGEAGDQYAFGTKVRCQRCGSLSTRAYATKENVQYRICQAAICRQRFVVRGEKI